MCGLMGLAEAVFNQEVERAAQLLAGGADANDTTSRRPDGSMETWASAPLLVVAAQMGNLRLVELLLEKGARINEPSMYRTTSMFHDEVIDQNGNPPIYYAICQGHANVVLYLLDRGVSAEPWMLRLATEYGGIEIVRSLLARGLDPNERVDGKTALDVALFYKKPELIALLQAKGGVRDQQSWDAKVLLAAARGWHAGLLEALAFGRPDCVSSDGRTPLMEAAALSPHEESVEEIEKRISCAKELLGRGASLETQDPRGRTALAFAVQSGKPAMVRLLCEEGARLAPPVALAHAIVRAATWAHAEVVALLCERARASGDENAALGSALESLAPEAGGKVIERLPALAQAAFLGRVRGACSQPALPKYVEWQSEPPRGFHALVQVSRSRELECRECHARFSLLKEEEPDVYDPYSGSIEIHRLRRLGPGPIDFLRRLELSTLLDDPDKDVRDVTAADLTSHLLAKDAWEGLLALLRHEDVSVREGSLWMLSMGAAPKRDLERLLPALLERVHDPSEDAQLRAGDVASRILIARKDYERLRDLLGDAGPMARFSTLSNLSKVPRALARLRPEIEPLRQHPNPLVRELATRLAPGA
jgi:ankyrin repeat protein